MDYKITPEHIKRSKELFDTLGIMYLHFPKFEADMIMKYLSENDFVDACYSGDMDLLTFGCKKIINDLNYNDDFVIRPTMDYYDGTKQILSNLFSINLIECISISIPGVKYPCFISLSSII